MGFGVPLAVECLAGGVSHERRCTTILIDGHQGMMVAGSDRDERVGDGDGGYEAGFTDLNQALGCVRIDMIVCWVLVIVVGLLS